MRQHAVAPAASANARGPHQSRLHHLAALHTISDCLICTDLKGVQAAAVLMLGAQGIVMGTRLVATDECAVHQRTKQALVNAGSQVSVTGACQSIGHLLALLLCQLPEGCKAFRQLSPHAAN